MSYKILDWDSNFFGYTVASMDSEDLIYSDLIALKNDFNTNDIKLIYIIIDNAKNRSDNYLKKVKGLTQNVGASLIDKKVIFEKEINYCQIETNNIVVYNDKLFDRSELYKLALISGEYSRFNMDVKFSNNEFERLYYKWIDNSINGTIADKVFIYQENNTILGFITMVLSQNKAKIGLIAVNPESRGKSIGRQLINYCEDYCFMNNLKTLSVATQLQNEIAMKFYSNIGFKTKKINYIYHLWVL